MAYCPAYLWALRYFTSSGASEASSISSVSSRGSAAVVHEQVARMHQMPALPPGFNQNSTATY